MRSSRVMIGGAAATAAVGVRVARSLYGRWRLLPEPGRARIAELAEDAKEKALALRGEAAPKRAAAEGELRSANKTLAAAIVETAEADPEIAAEEVEALRADLRRELERLTSAEVKASRGPGTPAPGDEVKRSGTRRGPGTPPG